MASFPSRRSRGFWFGFGLGGLLRRRRKDRRRRQGGWSWTQAPEQLEPRQLMAGDSYYSYSSYDSGYSYSSYDSYASYASYDPGMYGYGSSSAYGSGYTSGSSWASGDPYSSSSSGYGWGMGYGSGSDPYSSGVSGSSGYDWSYSSGSASSYDTYASSGSSYGYDMYGSSGSSYDTSSSGMSYDAYASASAVSSGYGTDTHSSMGGMYGWSYEAPAPLAPVPVAAPIVVTASSLQLPPPPVQEQPVQEQPVIQVQPAVEVSQPVRSVSADISTVTPQPSADRTTDVVVVAAPVQDLGVATVIATSSNTMLPVVGADAGTPVEIQPPTTVLPVAAVITAAATTAGPAANAPAPNAASATSVAIVARTVPGTPAAITGTPEDGRVRLAWKAPASDGGAPITDYVVQVSPDADGTWATINDDISAEERTELTGLADGTSYLFRVAAVNAVGVGAASAVSARLTPRTAMNNASVSRDGSGAGDSSGSVAATATQASTTAATATSSHEPAIGPPPTQGATTSSADVTSPADPPPPVVVVPDTSVVGDVSVRIAATAVPDGSMVVADAAASASLGSPDESAPAWPSVDSVVQLSSTVQPEPSLPAVATVATGGNESRPIITSVNPSVTTVGTGPEQAVDSAVVPVAPPALTSTTSSVGSLQDTAEASAATTTTTNGTATAGTTTTSDAPAGAAGRAGGSNNSSAGGSSSGSVVAGTSPSETTGALSVTNTGASGGTAAGSTTDGSRTAAGGGSSGAPSDNEGPTKSAGDSSGATGGSLGGEESSSDGSAQTDSASSDSIGDSSADDDVVRITYRVNLVALENSAYFFDPKFACIKSQQEKDVISGLAADALKTLGPNAALGYGDSVQHILQDQWTFSFWSLKSVEVDVKSNFAAFDPGPPPPFPVPGRTGPGFPGFPEWKWCPDGQDGRNGQWSPVITPPGRSPPSTSFHRPKPGESGVPHWDLNDGLGNRTYLDEQGNPLQQKDAKDDWDKDGDSTPDTVPFSPFPFMPGAAPGSHQSPQSPSGGGASGFWPAALRACFRTIIIMATPPSFKPPKIGSWQPPGENA